VLPLTVPEAFDAVAARRPGHPFLVFGDAEVSYAEARERIGRVAAGLARLGVAAGDRVACYLRNCPEFLWTWFAVNALGAALVPVNTAFQADEALYPVEHAGARLLVSGAEGFAVAREVYRRSGTLAELVVVGDGDWDRGIAFAELADESPVPLGGRARPEAIATFIYTSGTTGRPKGVMQPQRNYVLTGEGFRHWLGLGPADRLLTPLPLFHINAQAYSTMGAIAAEATLVLVERFSASRFWAEARRHGATQANVIGSMLALLAKAPPAPDDRDHRLRLLYGAPVPRELFAAFEQRFGVTLLEGYGLSECTFGTILPRDGLRKPGSMGLPRSLPARAIANEMKVVGSDGRECPPGEAGEIVIRNPVVMAGYHADPDATARALRDGWLWTGDWAYRDADGYFWFVDRRKDVIRRRGENIASSEVEAVLDAHPGVLESAVVGVPSALSEDDVVAVVVPWPGAPAPTEAELQAWCAGRLARFKVPTRVVFAESLPKTPTAKVQKERLRTELGAVPPR
jgi:crotonobetaine/carnitine-CoA ligase